MTSLHYECRREVDSDVITTRKLIVIGGRELVLEKDNFGRNALMYAVEQMRNRNTDVNIVTHLIGIGGMELVMSKDKWGRNSLHHATNCTHQHSGIEIFKKLISFGGRELFIERDGDGNTSLQTLVTINGHYINPSILLLLLAQGIQFQAGGEFGIGGLFDAALNEYVKDDINDKWNEYIIPAIQEIMADSPHHPPILQAAIINNAPPAVLKSSIQNLDCISITDSLGRYPIDVAIGYGLKWNDDGGIMKEVGRAFSIDQQRSVFSVCTKHGLQWENGMSTLCDTSDINDFDREDSTTGLYPFMIAATGGHTNYNLGTIFHLVKKSPGLVKL